jgi:hypothetical protein
MRERRQPWGPALAGDHWLLPAQVPVQLAQMVNTLVITFGIKLRFLGAARRFPLHRDRLEDPRKLTFWPSEFLILRNYN